MAGRRRAFDATDAMPIKVKIITVADIHASQKHYEYLAKAVATHRPDVVALVGDFLDATGKTDGKLTVEDCARALGDMPCAETIFVRGTHEDSAWWRFAHEFEKSGRELHLLEGACFTYGPLVMVGFPCLALQGDGLGADLPADPDKWLPGVLRPHLPSARSLWLMHEPPDPTPISDHCGPLSGNVEWRLAIERFMPKLVVFGHDHQTPIRTKHWNCHLGPTTCVNVGQTENGPLHYALVEMGFPQNSPCMPRSIKVTAYPVGKSLEVL
jgi:Icc-related predicted phosphoesterase